MLGNIVKKIIGSRNDREIKRLFRSVDKINALEDGIKSLDDEALKSKTAEFRKRLNDGEKLDNLLPEAFAVVREAGRRVLDMRHFDVQLVGGMVLHSGKIAEMRTGEGKTLVATLATYLNALPGKGVHVVTVNDYLARRDAEWMGRLYGFLGMTTGVIVGGLDHEQRKAAYASDITYGTNNEFGFDYLRDNMAFSAEQRVQRKPYFAVVDEVDSILIDEARTPLIISGPTEDSTDLYQRMNALVPQLKVQELKEGDEPEEIEGDYWVDEKARQVFLSEAGHEKVEKLLEKEGILEPGTSLYDTANIMLMHHVNAALRANTLFQRNVDYIVKNGEIVIVDEFTGRTMPGRRWSEGLHQAIEAREGVPIQNENQTMASITFQNYFRLYEKLSGMTGTADTEAYEFQQIYGLEVIVVPTHRNMVRDDMGDLVYMTEQEKFNAVVEDIQDCVKRGQPVLVGTASIETSEIVSGLLEKIGIEHNVLNAKHHAQEAQIIAQAGKAGAVTIATNMAGRGTDIVLGGSLEHDLEQLPEDTDDATVAKIREDWQLRHNSILESGGLHVIGTERHESRRVDNQLRGRSGRQGDPGSTRFYLSLQDSLMRIFASDRVSAIMQKLGMQEGEAIEHPWVSKAIENAQKKVEGRNFDIRKQLLEYDDVANDQRKVIYEQRNELMDTGDVSETVDAMRKDVVNRVIDRYVPPQSIEEQWDIEGLSEALEKEFGGRWPIQKWLDHDDDLHEETLRQRILDDLIDSYRNKEQATGPDVMRHFEKAALLQSLDVHWKEHLAAMDYLRQGIHLRGYAQKNPKQEYKREAFEMFSNLLDEVKMEVVSTLSKVQVKAEEDVAAIEEQRQAEQDFQFKHDEFKGFESDEAKAFREDRNQDVSEGPYVRSDRKVGRNEPCPCGSGKKYKQCHGKLQ